MTPKKKIFLIAIQLIVSLSLLYGDYYKFSGQSFSIELFTRMSEAAHGIVSQPFFRLGAGVIESTGAILFLIPRTARLGAAIIVCFMIGVILSHVFVLGYGLAFLIALATFALPALFLFLTRKGANGSLQPLNPSVEYSTAV